MQRAKSAFGVAVTVLLVPWLGCSSDGEPSGSHDDPDPAPCVEDEGRYVGVMNLTFTSGIGPLGPIAFAMFGEDVEDCSEDTGEIIAEIGACTVSQDVVSVFEDDDEDCADRLLDAGDVAELREGGAVSVMVRDGAGMYRLDAEADTSHIEPGDNVFFTFPGGDDIGAFEACIHVPHSIELIAPSSSTSLMRGTDLQVTWNTLAPAGGVHMILSGFEMQSPMTSRLVTIVCEFQDTGDAIIPAGVMAHLPESSPATTLSIASFNLQEVDVPLRNGCSIRAGISAQSIAQHVFTDNPSGVDLCGLAPCH